MDWNRQQKAIEFGRGISYSTCCAKTLEKNNLPDMTGAENNPNIPPLIQQSKGLSVKFSIGKWDLVRCRMWVIFHHRFILLLLLACSALVGFQTAFGLSTLPVAGRLVCGVLAAAFMFCFLACFQFAVQCLWAIVRPNRGVLGMHEFEIRDDGLFEKTDVNESLHRWSGFQKIGSTRNFLFIFVTDNIVHYFPWKAFASDQDAQRFLGEIRRRANIK